MDVCACVYVCVRTSVYTHLCLALSKDCLRWPYDFYNNSFCIYVGGEIGFCCRTYVQMWGCVSPCLQCYEHLLALLPFSSGPWVSPNRFWMISAPPCPHSLQSACHDFSTPVCDLPTTWLFSFLNSPLPQPLAL